MPLLPFSDVVNPFNQSLNTTDTPTFAAETITSGANVTALTASYSVTGANTTPLLNLSGTWNTTGVATGLKLNITNTASGTGSRLFEFQTSSVPTLSLTPAKQLWLWNQRTDDSNYERAFMRWNSNILEIGTEAGGTGTNRQVALVTAGTTVATTMVGSGFFDVKTKLSFKTQQADITSSAYGKIVMTDSGNAITGSPFLQWGGSTSSFPCIRRNGTTLQAKLADDSAFTAIQGKLTTDTAYTAGTVVLTGYITLYDSTGTAYRVPCAV